MDQSTILNNLSVLSISKNYEYQDIPICLTLLPKGLANPKAMKEKDP